MVDGDSKLLRSPGNRSSFLETYEQRLESRVIKTTQELEQLALCSTYEPRVVGNIDNSSTFRWSHTFLPVDQEYHNSLSSDGFLYLNRLPFTPLEPEEKCEPEGDYIDGCTSPRSESTSIEYEATDVGERYKHEPGVAHSNIHRPARVASASQAAVADNSDSIEDLEDGYQSQDCLLYTSPSPRD